MNKATIVCIEDEADLRELIAEELEDEGYRVVQAADGEEGVKAIIDGQPDLVISDIMMPKMSGYEVLRSIRTPEMNLRFPHFAEMPFIFLSAMSDRDYVITGFQLGADDYLSKPVDFDMLHARVAARLRQVRQIRESKAVELENLFIVD